MNYYLLKDFDDKNVDALIITPMTRTEVEDVIYCAKADNEDFEYDMCDILERELVAHKDTKIIWNCDDDRLQKVWW